MIEAAAVGTAIATLTVMRSEFDRLERLLPTLEWADECHVVITGPDAASAQQRDRNGVIFHHLPLPFGANFDGARAVALHSMRAEWVLVVDTDESWDPPLVRTIQGRLPEWHRDGVCGIWVPRLNHVLGRPLLHSSAWPDYQLRLVRRDAVRFVARLHRGIEVNGATTRLPAVEHLAVRHYNFTSTRGFLDKMNHYTDLEAIEATGAVPRNTYVGLLAACREFLARYVKMRGFLDGSAGLHYCLMMAFYRYLAVAKRWESASVGATGAGTAAPRKSFAHGDDVDG